MVSATWLKGGGSNLFLTPSPLSKDGEGGAGTPFPILGEGVGGWGGLPVEATMAGERKRPYLRN